MIFLSFTEHRCISRKIKFYCTLNTPHIEKKKVNRDHTQSFDTKKKQCTFFVYIVCRFFLLCPENWLQMLRKYRMNMGANEQRFEKKNTVNNSNLKKINTTNPFKRNNKCQTLRKNHSLIHFVLFSLDCV